MGDAARVARRRALCALALGLCSGCVSWLRSSSDSGGTPHALGRGEVLILFDDGGPYAHLGRLYATGAAILVSHFAPWRILPISQYRRGDLPAARAGVYLGSTFDTPLPIAFLDDALSGERPLMWIDNNIWQLARHSSDFADRYGYLPALFSQDSVHHVIYKGVHLDRQTRDASGIMSFSELDTTRVQVLAWAETSGGRQSPWALSSHNLLYIGENPFVFIGQTDRYLAFCDLLFELLAPDTPERHRALLRIEDVHPNTSPQILRAIGDYLVRAHVPFSVALVPVYEDPNGAENSGRPERRTLREAPALVAVLRHMQQHGATFVLHGYTHQYGLARNPYNGVTGDDFEFFRARVDADDNVIQTGPVPEDSAEWALDRVDRALAEIAAVGLPRPNIFEYPHYAGSVVDSRAIATRFPFAYHRGTYYGRDASGRPTYDRSISLFFPFVVRDIFGWTVIPENVGNYIPVGYNNNTRRGVRDMIYIAQINRVVRDGFASVFFHPMFEVSILRELVDGLRATGYEFVGVDRL